MQAFKSFGQEMTRILDIVGCYAVFKPEVGFTVKKQVIAVTVVLLLGLSTQPNKMTKLPSCRERQERTCIPCQEQQGKRISGSLFRVC